MLAKATLAKVDFFSLTRYQPSEKIQPNNKIAKANTRCLEHQFALRRAQKCSACQPFLFKRRMTDG